VEISIKKPKGSSKMEYQITPIPKPRMTQRDRWLDPPRECVRVYRNFCDLCNLNKIHLPPSGGHVTFILPMPESWSSKQKILLNGAPHNQTPDIDNLLKAINDALFSNDSFIWDIHVTKRWGFEGKIIIEMED
jgi:hypothetical protein